MNAQQTASIQTHARYAEACLRNADAAAIAHDWPAENMWRGEAQWNAERAFEIAQGA